MCIRDSNKLPLDQQKTVKEGMKLKLRWLYSKHLMYKHLSYTNLQYRKKKNAKCIFNIYSILSVEQGFFIKDKLKTVVALE